MNTSIVYSVVSDSNDIYLEQALIAIYSLRIFNEKAFVILVIDKETDNSLIGSRKNILHYINKKIVIEAPTSYNKMQRSRHLKTSIRNIVEGDYLFLDTDTIVTDDLSYIDYLKGDLFAVPDLHHDINTYPNYHPLIKKAKIIGWQLTDSDRFYYNSGVFFVRDTPQNRDFYFKWNKNWKHSMEKGLSTDQPALAKTNAEFSFPIQVLDGTWNCQILKYGLPFLHKAKIIHYFGSNIDNDDLGSPFFLFSDKSVFEKLKPSMQISEDLHSKIINCKSLLSSDYSLLYGKEYFFYRTNVYTFFKTLYHQHNIIFNLMDSILKFIKQVNRIIHV